MRTSVRRLREEDLPVIHELYAEVFGQAALEWWKQRWKWQFVDNPSTAYEPSRLWVAELDGAPVGALSSFPARLRIRDREITIFYPCDLLVSDRAVGFGLGRQLIRTHMESPNNPLPNALQYSEGNALIHDLLRYRKVMIQPVYLRPYNTRAIGETFLVKLGEKWNRPTWVLSLAKGVGFPAAHVLTTSARILRRPSRSKAVSIERVQRPGPEFDALWESVRSEFPIVPVRDRAWVHWRYTDDPLNHHDLLLARDRDGQPVGYAAVSMTSRRALGLSVGRIMDLFASPHRADVVRTLLAEALETLESRKPDLISCMGLHPALRKVVRRYLFVQPRRFESPARLRWQGDPELEDLVFDPTAWHLSYADGDDAFT